MDLGNSPIIMPPVMTSTVYRMLRSIQSELRPRVIELRNEGKRRWVGSIHNGRPTKALLLVLQTTLWMTFNAGTLFHSECF
jgi:hypothetical protein